MARHTPVFDAWRTACAYADALVTSRGSSAVWQAQQGLRLHALLQGAARRCAFYRERLAAAVAGQRPAQALETLRRLQPTRKHELMRDFDRWVCDPALTLAALRAFVSDRGNRGEAFDGRYLVWESSGSSAEPALFVQDARALAVADALEAARGPASLAADSSWPGPWSGVAGGGRIALVAATEGHFASIVAFERARELNPWLARATRSFSFMQPLAQLVAQLNAYAPTVLATYPSMAWVLCEAQRQGQLRIAPQAVWTGGETLTPALRRTLGDGFHAPVRDSYGASECFLIANECRCGCLHVNADWVILEPVDKQGRTVPEGEVGATTLLTNLANHVQPIIRYDLGDRVRFVPGACACGSSLPMIEVEGRADDVLTLDDAHGHAVHLAPLALTTVIEDEAGVFDFQLRRRGPHSVQLDVFGAGASDAPRAAAALRVYLRAQGLGGTRVNCQCPAHHAARGRSGKQPRVVCQSAERAAARATRSRSQVHQGAA